MGKKDSYYNRCLELSGELFAQKDRLSTKDFTEKFARANCAKTVPDWNNLSEAEKQEHKARVMASISSSIRKALNKLHRDGKIGRIGNSYMSITDFDIKEAENYLFNHLRPSQNIAKKISEGTYILSLEKEDVPYAEEFTFFKDYNGNIQKIEYDLKKVTEFILQSEKRRADKVIQNRNLSSNLRSYIGKQYCYDVLVEDERLIVLLNIEAAKKGTDMSEQEAKDTEKSIVTKLNNLIKRIYESNHQKTILKKDGGKRIEGDRYLALENDIMKLDLKKHKLSRKTLVNELNLTTYQAGHMLRRMVANGKLKLVGNSGAGAYYKRIKK